MILHDWVLATLTPILLLLLLPCRHSQVSAALANVTVDDSGPDPLTGSRIMYSPSDAWSFGQDCTACTARPDPNQAFMHSWHDGTFNPVAGSNNDPNTVLTATFQFQGSAIYVFCILAHTSVSPDGNSDMTFLIDGQPVGSFAQSPTGATNYDFNVPVYVNASLPDGMHTFTLENGHVNGMKSLVLLDYIVYTTGALASDPPSPGTSIIPSGTPLPTQTSNTSSTTSTSVNSSFTGSSTLATTTSPISALNGAGVTLSTNTPSSSASTVQQVSGNSAHSLTSRDRIIIIVACSVGGLLILLSIGLAIYYFRRRQYNDYTAPDIYASGSAHIAEHPGASGWVEGTWGPKADEAQHPSLVSTSLRRTHTAQASNTTTNTMYSQPSAESSDRGGPGVGSGSAMQVRTGGDAIVAVRLPASSSAHGHGQRSLGDTVSPTASSSRYILSSGPSGSGHAHRESEAEGSTSAVSSPLYSSASSPSISPVPYYSAYTALPVPAIQPPLTRSESERAAQTVRFVPNRHPDLIRGASASAITSIPENRATEGSGGSGGNSVGGGGSSGSGGIGTSGVSTGGGAQLRPLSPGKRPRPLAMVLDANGRRLDVGENSRPPSYETARR